MSADKQKQNRNLRRKFVAAIVSMPFFLAACAEIERPAPEPFYAQTTPPAKQEFRWSNGSAPKSFDPARAAAAPETDIVRALFEGLTDIDARTLKEVPAMAEKWSSSPDLRVWTFYLRKNARWSNGQRVTASDFVTSWKRLIKLGESAAHPGLFQNISGMRPIESSDGELGNVPGKEPPTNKPPASIGDSQASNPGVEVSSEGIEDTKTDANAGTSSRSAPQKFGVEAVDEITLRITLEMPDKDFPKLVANSMFRPIFGNGAEFDGDRLDAGIITNGPFTVASISKEALTLDRSDSYWNKAGVTLEHLKFVFKDSAEAALSAYKKGEIDALTNAEFEPLAVKILSPYDDFRQTTHSALNLYEFNTRSAPFNDRRVREALSISIDRPRVTDGELERMARPATSFLPLTGGDDPAVTLNVERAKQLMESAGFAAGAAFPKVRLLINRNDTQQRVARAVARMWKQNLNIDTEIIVKELSEIEAVRATGGYDLVRRGIVLPTVDEAVGIATIFGLEQESVDQSALMNDKSEADAARDTAQEGTRDGLASPHLETGAITTEVQALSELNAIPLYFPMAYSLVKPYVRGFDINGLGPAAPGNIRIDSNWQPKVLKGGS